MNPIPVEILYKIRIFNLLIRIILILILFSGNRQIPIGGELGHFVSAKCAAWMYRMRRSSAFGKGARWVCALSLAGRAGCGAGSGIQTLPPL